MCCGLAFCAGQRNVTARCVVRPLPPMGSWAPCSLAAAPEAEGKGGRLEQPMRVEQGTGLAKVGGGAQWAGAGRQGRADVGFLVSA